MKRTLPKWSGGSPGAFRRGPRAENGGSPASGPRRQPGGWWRAPGGGAVLAAAFVTAAFAYKEVPPPAKVVLPAARSPAESRASITVPAGLEVELVAAEPLTRDPIDVAWGADGRLWVVEMADYPAGLDGRGKPGGRIRFLESTRGDGRYDRSTLFAEGLNFPTSVMPWRGGVLVVAVPDVLFLEDTDGDGRADRTTRWFTGLGEGNPQHLVNGLQWSLDGWLHLANGNSGGRVASARSPGSVVELGQRDFQIEPDRGAVELLAGQSQAGRNRDDWGNWFGCNNSNPVWHYVLEERYLRRNPHLVSPPATVSVSSAPGAARVYPKSETTARFNDPQGFNHFTSACGVMIYRDELLGPAYAGNVFVCEPVHNLVHREVMRPAGATFRSERAPAEQQAEFLVSTDNWSRFTAVRAGPDGALYVVDMYRLVIEHPKWIPDAWQKQLGDLRAGEHAGRIYRIRPTGAALRPVPKLEGAALGDLIHALESPSGLWRDLAQQQLTWRNDPASVPLLERLAATSPRPTARAQALWTLQTMKALRVAAVAQALQDDHAGVRRQAVRLGEALGRGADARALRDRVAAMVDDPDLSVRLQVGYALGEWTDASAGVALARLLRTTDDRFVRAAALSSALPHAETLIEQLTAAGGPDDPLVVEIAAVTENARALSALWTAIAAPRDEAARSRALATLASLLDWLQRNNTSLAQLQARGGEAMRSAMEAADGLFAAARGLAADARAPLTERLTAVQVLGRGRSKQAEDVELLAGLLGPQHAVELQLASIAALGRINRPVVPERLMAGWNAYGGSVRAAVLDLMLARPAWAHVLLDRIEADTTLLAHIDVTRRMALTQHANARVAERASAILARDRAGDRQTVIDRYLAALSTRRGEAARGEKVFAATCSACHRFGATPGRGLGPDLASVKDRSPPYLLTHILDPNRAVEDRYVFYTATTQDGRTLAGTLAGETGNSVTLLGLDGTEQVILRSEVRALGGTGRSLMPDGLEAAVDEQAMADLIAFLSGAATAPR